MRTDEKLIVAFCIAALIALVGIWGRLLLRGAEPPARPVPHAYAPFTVEVSVRDR